MTDYRAMAAAAQRESAARMAGKRALSAGSDPELAFERLKAIGLPLLEEAKAGLEAERIPRTIRLHPAGHGAHSMPALEFFCGLRRVRLRATGPTADVRGVSLYLYPAGEAVEAWVSRNRLAPLPDEKLEGDLASAVRAGVERCLRTYLGEIEGLTALYGIVF